MFLSFWVEKCPSPLTSAIMFWAPWFISSRSRESIFPSLFTSPEPYHSRSPLSICFVIFGCEYVFPRTSHGVGPFKLSTSIPNLEGRKFTERRVFCLMLLLEKKELTKQFVIIGDAKIVVPHTMLIKIAALRILMKLFSPRQEIILSTMPFSFS